MMERWNNAMVEGWEKKSRGKNGMIKNERNGILE
jgi:hypothetical protein